MKFQVEYRMTGTLLSIRAIATSLRELMEVEPSLGKEAQMLDLAITEAMNNVVLHAYRDCEGEMRVSAKFDDKTFTVVVIDEGEPPDIQRVDSNKKRVDDILNSCAESLESCGRGVALMIQIMDEVHHCRIGKENHVVMTRVF